jgi:hypothetical protein
VLVPREDLPLDIAPSFQVTSVHPVRLMRLDSVWPSDEMGAPTFIKIDVQGYELKVLAGCGSLLRQTVCVELETRVARHYEEQPSPLDICEYMTASGFDLVKFSPNGYKGRQICVFNAYFVRRSEHDSRAARLWKRINNVGSAHRVNTWNY